MIIIVENTAAGRQGAGAVESLPTYPSSTWRFRELTENAVGF